MNETVTINFIDYVVVQSKTVEDLKAEGLVNLVDEMKKSKIARSVMVRKPNGRVHWHLYQYESGNWTRMTRV